MGVASLAPVRERLANGLTLLVKETRTQPTVTISAMVSAGSTDDPPGSEGAAQLLCRLLDRGAGTHSSDDIADLLDVRGISPAIGATRHATTISCDCLAEDVDVVLPLVCDMVRSPLCPDSEVQVRRGQLLTQLRQDEENPAARALQAAMILLYGERHPVGRPPKGFVQTVETIGREQLLRFHAAQFGPDRLTLVLVGHIAMSDALAAVTRACGEWVPLGQAASVLPPPPAPSRRRQVVSLPGKSQADIVYGFTTIPRSDPAYYSYWVMNNILGQYGVGGRLGRRIREEQGMAYYAGSVFDAGPIAGPLLVRAGVSATNVDRAIASIDVEVDRLADQGATAAELENAKRYLVGSIPRSLETNAGIAQFLQTAELYGLGLDYDRQLPDRVQAVTDEDVARAAASTLASDRAAIAIAGPYEGE